LDENPLTLPNSDSPHMDKKVMQNYLEALHSLLEHYVEEEKRNNN
jgi:hypothetical protein